MLSGYVPFHAKAKHESASDIMNRIRKAQFSFDGDEWRQVSDEAKQLISGIVSAAAVVVVLVVYCYTSGAIVIGLLTVDPEKRLDACEVLHHSWLRKGFSPDTPLQTPTLLNSSAGKVAIVLSYKSFALLVLFPLYLVDLIKIPFNL